MNNPDGPVKDAGRRAVRIEIDLRWNMIAVILGDPDVPVGPDAGAEQAGLLDVGAGGRLVGLEVGDHYVGISDALAGTEHLTRSVAVPLWVNRAPDGSLAAVLFGRSGNRYEISFPSGNQCWMRESGDSFGAVILYSHVLD